MKLFFTVFALIAVLLAAYPFFDASKKTEILLGLPWQIEIQADGSTQIFGLHIGTSRLSDAISVLGNDMDLAVVAAPDETGNLEMYYGHYRAGLLSGKMVILSDASQQDVQRWRANAVREEYMTSGAAKKYYLAESDLNQAFNKVVTGLTFIPVVDLDETLVVERFGEPKQRITDAGVVHYLYPDKGLHISIYADAKEVLQYVSPRDFQQLTQSLLPQ